MIPREEISRLSYRLQMNELIIEKDYVLTWLLLSIADSKLFPILIFKGGTALKRIYFPNYRYSEDLDFTLLEKITPENLLFLRKKLKSVKIQLPFILVLLALFKQDWAGVLLK